MAQRSRDRRRRQDDAPAPVDDVTEEFLARISAVEARDPDEPGRWAGFFARIREALGIDGGDGEDSPE